MFNAKIVILVSGKSSVIGGIVISQSGSCSNPWDCENVTLYSQKDFAMWLN